MLTDKQRQLLLWLRIGGGTRNYLAVSHSPTTVHNCKKYGWVVVSQSKTNYLIALTSTGVAVLGEGNTK